MYHPKPAPSVEKRRLLLRSAPLALAGTLPRDGRAKEAAPRHIECIVPAKEGGGFDLTCKTTKQLLDASGLLPSPIALRYIPGGIGALVYKQTVTRLSGDADKLIAFSGGSLLNIAQRKFGPYAETDVRWLAALGMDYGVVAVNKTSPIANLRDLVTRLQTRPNDTIFGAGGTIGSQDWIKAAEIARAAQYDFKLLRYIAFEGGGDAITALEGGYVHVVTGDAAELTMHLQRHADVRVIAALSEKRLPGPLASVPTAREQGFDITWPIIRGFYLGPRVSDADYDAWLGIFQRLVDTPGYTQAMNASGMRPYFIAGNTLTAYVTGQVAAYRQLAQRYKLI